MRILSDDGTEVTVASPGADDEDAVALAEALFAADVTIVRLELKRLDGSPLEAFDRRAD